MSKQVIILNMEADMGVGRLAAHAAHASIAVLLDMGEWTESNVFEIGNIPHPMRRWMKESFTKVVVKSWGNDTLRSYHAQALSQNIPASLIEEDGYVTAVAIGPADVRDVDPITRTLPLL
jgi:peptidyl-tRNA hydrolase